MSDRINWNWFNSQAGTDSWQRWGDPFSGLPAPDYLLLAAALFVWATCCGGFGLLLDRHTQGYRRGPIMAFVCGILLLGSGYLLRLLSR